MNPERFIAALNPLLSQPLEVGANKDFYTGQPITENTGLRGVLDRLGSGAMNVIPPAGQAMRLSGGGRYDGLEAEKWANYLGVPFYEATPDRMAGELRRRSFEG